MAANAVAPRSELLPVHQSPSSNSPDELHYINDLVVKAKVDNGLIALVGDGPLASAPSYGGTAPEVEFYYAHDGANEHYLAANNGDGNGWVPATPAHFAAYSNQQATPLPVGTF